MPNTKIAKKVTHNNPFNELADLPPSDFIESPEILRHLAKAARHLGELNGLCASLPDTRLLVSTIVLQESKIAAIENIVTTQDELYKAASEEGTASFPTKEILSYREALYVR